MLDHLKSALVSSYVGAIALGYIMAQCALHFINVFAMPIAGWITRDEYKNVVAHGMPMVGFTFRDGIPELVRLALLLAVWFVLLRWLYLTPLKRDQMVPTPDADQT